jgi:hypothetical protein
VSTTLGKVQPIDTPGEYLNLDDPIAAYRGNPLIGALGPIRTKEQIRDLLTVKPAYDPAERRLPAHLRPHTAFALREFFLPGIAHMAAVKEVDLLIRQSYKYRNPLDPRYRRQWTRDQKDLKEGRRLPQRYATVPSLGAAVIGPPGTGKTLSIDFAIKDIVPVAEHAYLVDGDRVAFTQLPCLKINLFQDGSLKSFGREIFDQAEQTLSIPLAHDWGVDRANGNRIQSLYFQLCHEYNVGLFVVDEFQLIQAAHDGTRRALNYFVRLMNCIGVAVVVIGSQTTAGLLKENMAASRRFLSAIPPYTPFVAGQVWNAFFGQVARYRYVAEMDPLADLSAVVLELSGGIPDLAVKLILLSQMRLFGRKKERLTADVLRETSKLLFYTVQDRLVELKGKAPEAKGIETVAKTMNEAFNAIAHVETERVGAEPIAGLEPPRSAPITISADVAETMAGKMKKAAKAGDKLAALEALGIVAHPA